jgi:hypothetical protein
MNLACLVAMEVEIEKSVFDTRLEEHIYLRWITGSNCGKAQCVEIENILVVVGVSRGESPVLSH